MKSDLVCVISGAGGALGTALAEVLAERGYALALFDGERSREKLEALVTRFGRERAIAHTGDLSQATTWRAAVEASTRSFGAAPSCAALLAGGWTGGSPVHAGGDETALQRMMVSNVETAHQGLRALLPSMVTARRGSVVVVGSRAAVRPWTSAGAAVYAASKSAVVALAAAVAEEVLEQGVRVNAVLPSTMDTAANRAAMPDVDPSRWVSLGSASRVIAFLLSDDARDISGAAIPLYGRA